MSVQRYSYDRRMAAAVDEELAKTYADAWSDALIGKFAPKHLTPTKLGALLRDVWINDVGGNIRNLQWRSSKWTSVADWAAQMKVICPEYNAFHAVNVGRWLAKFSGVEVQAAREYSVCLYLKGDVQTLVQIASEAKRSIHADEAHLQVDDSLRLWWD